MPSQVHGHPTGVDGMRGVRRSTKAKWRARDEFVARGVPVVLFHWVGAQLD